MTAPGMLGTAIVPGFRSLRTRIPAWYGVLIALCLTTYSAVVGVSYRQHVELELNRGAQEDLELAVRAIRVDEAGVPSWPTSVFWKEVKEEEGGGHWIDVWDSAGKRVLAVGTGVPARLGTPDARSVGKGPTSIELPNGPFRVASERVDFHGTALVVRAAVSEAPARHEVRSLWRELAVLSAAVLLFGALGGYLLARRSLGPLSRMADHARRISAERLNERLPPDDAGTELNSLREAFNETLARLERSFAGLQTFSAHASHELRTPLTVVRSVGEVGLSQPRTDAELREIIGTILEEVDRLARLVDALLALARAGVGGERLRIEQVDIASLVREVVDRLAVLAEERAQRLEARADGLACVTGDRLALRQAVQNLVDNAIKYAPNGSRIDVRVGSDPGHVVVEVRDEGPGIPDGERDRVFEPFHRLSGGRTTERDGFGLGLSIVKATAKAHGGRIEVESEEGAGSTFRLYLPVGGAG